MGSLVAGHLFGSDDRCSCGRKWTDIMHVDDAYAGEDGYAHTGALNANEIGQIRVERERRFRIYEEATYGVASGSGHTWKNPDNVTFDDVETE